LILQGIAELKTPDLELYDTPIVNLEATSSLRFTMPASCLPPFLAAALALPAFPPGKF